MSEMPRSLPTIISRQLRALERSLRIHVALDGLATTVPTLLVLLAVDFALDRFFEFSQAVRSVLLVGLALSTGIIVWRCVLRRLFAPLRRDQLAMVFEHFMPSLGESLITAVQWEETPRPNEADPVLIRQTVLNAADVLARAGSRTPRRFFRYGRSARRIALAVSIAALGVVCCAAFSETAGLWFSRNILLSDRDWPRRSRLIVDGFQDGRIRVGRGDSLTLTVRADTRRPLVPETIRIRIGTKESGYRTLLIDRFRVDTLEGVDWRVFSHTFAELLETLPLQIRGADSILDGLSIDVVPPPILTDIKLRQRFPDYMNRAERTVAAGARMTIPDGTSVILDAESSKALLDARIVVNRGESVSIRGENVSPGFRSLHFEQANLRSDTLFEFLLEDVDHLGNRQPIRIELAIVKDQPPTVTARLDGIGSAVTPSAVLPVSGEITDDNGLATLQFRHTVRRPAKEKPPKDDPEEKAAEKTEQSPSDAEAADETGTTAITGLGDAQSIFSLAQDFPLSELNLLPGDTLTLNVEATDRFDLDEPKKGQHGAGPQWTMDVVTPERLRSLLEVREIALRQRFEVLIGEVERTKTLIDEIGLDAPEELVRESETMTLPNETLTDADEEKRREELAALKQAALETISREQATSGLYNISRALRDTQKEVYELRTLIESFRLIRREMVNNRIFSDDVRQRLDSGIIAPIALLVDADFPEVDRRIELLNGTLELRDRPLRTEARERRKAALEQFDRILSSMIAIRDNMVSMESFNEAVEILRAIIRQQRQLRIETLEEKSRRLKNLTQ